MKITTQHANCDYLTNGKEYEIQYMGKLQSLAVCFIDDNGKPRITMLENSYHLNGHSWEVKDD